MIVLAVILFVVLTVISGTSDEWELNGGESRETNVRGGSFLVRSISIEGYADVFNFNDGCPSLTGTPIIMNKTYDITLQRDDYQYDQFYLNKGSRLEITVDQSRGATDILLFTSRDSFDDWQDEDIDSSDGDANRAWYVQQGQPPADLHYSAHRSDFYTIVYNNDYHRFGEATVSYKITATTFDLDGQNPYCPSDEFGCKIAVAKSASSNQCIIVRIPTDVTSTIVSTHQQRVWSSVLALAAIPLIILFCKQKRPSVAGYGTIPTTTTTTTPISASSIPATNPNYTPIVTATAEVFPASVAYGTDATEKIPLAQAVVIDDKP